MSRTHVSSESLYKANRFIQSKLGAHYYQDISYFSVSNPIAVTVLSSSFPVFRQSYRKQVGLVYFKALLQRFLVGAEENHKTDFNQLPPKYKQGTLVLRLLHWYPKPAH